MLLFLLDEELPPWNQLPGEHSGHCVNISDSVHQPGKTFMYLPCHTYKMLPKYSECIHVFICVYQQHGHDDTYSDLLWVFGTQGGDLRKCLMLPWMRIGGYHWSLNFLWLITLYSGNGFVKMYKSSDKE